METVKLNNGVEMPILGYGVFQVDPATVEMIIGLARQEAENEKVSYCFYYYLPVCNGRVFCQCKNTKGQNYERKSLL